MPRTPTIEELCRKYRNEDAHSRHVAAMALAIWDAAGKALDLPQELRPLLEAAALLHDIGYDGDPDDHHAAGARLIRRHGVAGLRGDQVGVVAATVLLHRKDFEAAYADPLFGRDAASASATAIGAILRIADGLDYCHCQNARILSIRVEQDRLVCVVSSPGYNGNLGRATEKADLWRRAFGRDFVIEEHPGQGRRERFAGIVLPQDTMAGAMRKLLLLHYRLFTGQREGILEGQSDEPLHEARLAIRRYRAVVKTCARYGGGGDLRELDGRLGSLCRKLSRSRDLDVWQSFLEKQKRSPAFEKDRAFGRFCEAQAGARLADHAKLAAILDGEEYRSLVREMARLPRTRLAGGTAGAPLVPFAARKIAAECLTIAARAEIGKDDDPEKVHLLRKRCRAARYRAEFFEPLEGGAKGKAMSFFVALFKALSDALGELHDADCAGARVRQASPDSVQRLMPVLEAVKKRQFAAYRRACKALYSGEGYRAAGKLWREGSEGIPILYLVRHATAADGGPDRERPLTRKGVAEATTLGRALALLGCRPGLVASSPLVRALSTARLLRDKLSLDKETTITASLEGDAAPAAAARFLSESGATSLLCVGHLPHLGNLVRYLCRGSGKEAAMAKASVCCIAFPEGKIAGGAGVAVWYFPQMKLRRLLDRIHARAGKSGPG
jgi:exopolyphosphatase/guanosine-5'-triphosphate,3'-diphosphate pyrophosphatase